MITFGAIAPHGDVEETPELLAAMQELGWRCTSATRGRRDAAQRPCGGTFRRRDGGAHRRAHDRPRAVACDRRCARADGLPILGVSYGGNVPATAELPLDWGTEVPLNFVQAKQVVVVAPARDRPLDEHIRLGAAIARATGERASR